MENEDIEAEVGEGRGQVGGHRCDGRKHTPHRHDGKCRSTQTHRKKPDGREREHHAGPADNLGKGEARESCTARHQHPGKNVHDDGSCFHVKDLREKNSSLKYHAGQPNGDRTRNQNQRHHGKKKNTGDGKIEKSYKLLPQAKTRDIKQGQRRFNMARFAVDKDGEEMSPGTAATQSACLSAACALGYGAMLFASNDNGEGTSADSSTGEKHGPMEEWFRFSLRAFGVTGGEQPTQTNCANAWEWMFCGSWKEHDNSAHGAAQRIRDYLADTPIRISRWSAKRASEQDRLVAVLKRTNIEFRVRNWSAETLNETVRIKIRETLAELASITEIESELRVSGREIVGWARGTLSNGLKRASRKNSKCARLSAHAQRDNDGAGGPSTTLAQGTPTPTGAQCSNAAGGVGRREKRSV